MTRTCHRCGRENDRATKGLVYAASGDVEEWLCGPCSDLVRLVIDGEASWGDDSSADAAAETDPNDAHPEAPQEAL
jgi:hypothetical protein